MSLTEGSVRVALGDALHNKWTPANTAGYDPNAAEGDASHLDIHLGQYDEDGAFPQLALKDVSGQQIRSAWKADGSGSVHDYAIRIDAQAFVGEADDLPENSQLLAKAIGNEVRRIVHATPELMDSSTGALLAVDGTPLSEPVVGVDDNREKARYFATVEVGYEQREEP